MGGAYHVSGVYAHDPDLWTDPGSLSGRSDPDLLSGLQYAVLQERSPAQRLSIFRGADPCRIRYGRIQRSHGSAQSASGRCGHDFRDTYNSTDLENVPAWKAEEAGIEEKDRKKKIRTDRMENSLTQVIFRTIILVEVSSC